MINLTELAIFAQVVESKSFSAAAEQLGLSKSAVSKYITRLEACLGARLLYRTTRHVSLTEAGTALYEHCTRILAEVQEAEVEVARLHEAPRGLLKMNAHASFGELHLVPAIAEFMTRYPEVQVDLTLNNQVVHPIEEGVDLAIRAASALPDSSLMARRLAPNRVVVCATPDYFTRRGVPQTPEELRQHNCLIYTPLGPQQWCFKGPHGEYPVPVAGNFRADQAEALRAAVLSGLGVSILPTFLVGEDVRAGALQVVFSGLVAFTSAVYAVYPPTRHLVPKVRVFVDFLAARFGPRPYWDDLDQAVGAKHLFQRE
ncbi:MAG TPA: LysR family transcriptional regulator [Candidatus Binatia bacterium]|nr:LysR family transcriptional regulator [Candidatus Binatia bacterium]